MAYKVKELAEISGISVRTLHYYDEIGPLKPSYISKKEYRYYEGCLCVYLIHPQLIRP